MAAVFRGIPARLLEIVKLLPPLAELVQHDGRHDDEPLHSTPGLTLAAYLVLTCVTHSQSADSDLLSMTHRLH